MRRTVGCPLSRGFLPWRLPYVGPRVRGWLCVGPTSGTIHTSGRGTVPTIVDRTLRRQAADDTVVSLRAIGSYVASNFPMFSESSAESLATCGLFAPRRDRTMPPLRQVHGPRVDCHGACRERRYSFRIFWVADEPPTQNGGEPGVGTIPAIGLIAAPTAVKRTSGQAQKCRWHIQRKDK